MDNFYIITNLLKDADLKITNEIKTYIEEHGKKCILSEKDEQGHIIPGTVPKGIECGLVLGGDGTLIRAARELRSYGIPLLGINLGTLGYLTEVEVNDFRSALDSLFFEEPRIEERMMLQGTINGKFEETAMNDIVVTREGELRVIQFDIYVNGGLLNTYVADGVIISTPTGTTGYNLSAGGPIVDPTAKLFVITPICPHALNKSSVVLSAEDVIDVVISDGRYGKVEQASTTFDGAIRKPIFSGDKVSIRQAKETIHLIRIGKESFMNTMRTKMKGN